MLMHPVQATLQPSHGELKTLVIKTIFYRFNGKITAIVINWGM
jgi:hypothetical protein